MMMLEKHKSYNTFREFNQKYSPPHNKRPEPHSNMKLAIGKRGRPTDTLIFQMELSQPIELGDNEKKYSPKTNNSRSVI